MTRMHKCSIGALVTICAVSVIPTSGYVLFNWWDDSANIVMDDVFLPAATWSAPAQFQLSEWNQIDTTSNNHPFLINASPQFSFGSDDGDNTMGFLDEAGLNSEYGLSYVGALAWTACYSSFWTGRIDECDIMVDTARPWSLGQDDEEWLQSTVVHEAGHVRGLSHYNGYLSVMNSGVNKKLRAETLYMDDKEAVRAHNSYVNEYDMAIYPKWHDGSAPQWMSSPSPTTLREGDVIQWNNITVENRGTLPFGSLGVGFYMSTNNIISTGDTFLNSGSWPSFGRYTFSTFNWSATVPTVSDCGTRYFGGIIDYPNAWAERFEGNNSTPFHDGGPDPQPYTILLARDFLEPNDSLAGARNISMPFNANLSIDQDMESDYYRFTTSGFFSNVSATITFTHANGDVDLQLLNSAGTVIASSTGVSNSESISRWVGAGTYYLRVYGYSTGSCNRYTINATATPLIIFPTPFPFVSNANPNEPAATAAVSTAGNSGSMPVVRIAVTEQVTASLGPDTTSTVSPLVAVNGRSPWSRLATFIGAPGSRRRPMTIGLTTPYQGIAF